MFEWLKKYKKILVTGPQRSGTRICARMISCDVGYPYVDEEDIHMDSLYTFSHYIFNDTPFVIQCPALCRYIHYFKSENWAVIFMNRKSGDIISSQKRIGWSWEWLERLRYDKTEGEISEIKNRYRGNVQKKKLENTFEIEYESLSDHPMWIDKEKRSSFSPDQFFLTGGQADEIPGLYPFRSPGVSSHFPDDGVAGILINSNRSVRQVSSTGVGIWKHCDGRSKSRDIAERIKSDFHGTDENKIVKDTMKFIMELAEERFVQLLRFPLS